MSTEVSVDRESPGVRVLVVDDDRLVGAGIAGILTAGPGIDVVAQAADGHEAVELVSAHRLDVVLLDIQMPKLNGIEALREIRRRRVDLPVAMLTTFSDESLIASAIEEGALGFLLKSDEPQQLISGVHALAEGGAAFSPRIARWLAEREHAGLVSQRVRLDLDSMLTPRQLELLRLLGEGRSNAAIAETLQLSEGTVKQYVSALFDALGVDNRVNAAVLAYRAGLID